MTLRRISKEHLNLQTDPSESFSAGPVDNDDLFHWTATITGPPDSPYARGTFNIKIDLSQGYPHKAPHLAFVTPVFHPNVSSQGEIGLAEFEKTQWSPAIIIRHILLSVQAMLSDPNLVEGCILNEEAAKSYMDDKGRFRERASQFTETHAVQ